MDARRLTGVSALVLLLAAPAACTSDPSNTPHTFTPTLEWGECPADVEVTFSSRHRCGVLTVLADRDEPAGATVSMIVAQVWPEGEVTRPGLMVSHGADLGTPDPISGGITAGATRLGGVGVKIESRGVGPHTDPVLTCPEVDALAPSLAAVPGDDPGALAAVVDAVRTCAERLRGDGIDPADFDTAASIADLEDLRELLEIDRWAMNNAYGTQSRHLYAALRDHPERLGPAYLDSPVPPGVDDLTLAAEGTRRGLAELFAACESDPRCGTGERLGDAWERALARADAEPLEGRGDTVAGERVPVVVDDVTLIRAVHHALADDHGLLADLPAAIRAAAHGELHPSLASSVAGDPGLCLGVRPVCGSHDFAWGVHLTGLCRDQLPFVDEARLTDVIAGDPAYEGAFGLTRWERICAAWDVAPADQAPATLPEQPPVPLLLMVGRFDPYTDRGWAEALAGSSSGRVQVLVGDGGHNVLGWSACLVAARDAWAQTPDSPLTHRPCRDRIRWSQR